MASQIIYCLRRSCVCCQAFPYGRNSHITTEVFHLLKMMRIFSDPVKAIRFRFSDIMMNAITGELERRLRLESLWRKNLRFDTEKAHQIVD